MTVKGQAPPDNASGANWVVGRSHEEALAAAKAKFPAVKTEDIVLEQDPDVLDTWFSSGLFPFSVFGWPEKTPDLDKYYPTTFLETGSGISLLLYVLFLILYIIFIYSYIHHIY